MRLFRAGTRCLTAFGRTLLCTVHVLLIATLTLMIILSPVNLLKVVN